MSTNHGTQNAAAFQALQPRDIPVTDADREAAERILDAQTNGYCVTLMRGDAIEAIARARADAEVWEKAWKCGHEAAFTKHDAEVLERAAKAIEAEWGCDSHCTHVHAAVVRALAAQEVTK